MKYFLSEERRKKLFDLLIEADIPETKALQFAEVKDDLKAVDEDMLIHVQCIQHFRAIGDQLNSTVGLAILVTYMDEALSRGLSENDFPRSLVAIKDDLSDRGISVQ